MFACDAVLNGNGQNAREMGTFLGSERSERSERYRGTGSNCPTVAQQVTALKRL